MLLFFDPEPRAACYGRLSLRQYLCPEKSPVNMLCIRLHASSCKHEVPMAWPHNSTSQQCWLCQVRFEGEARGAPHLVTLN